MKYLKLFEDYKLFEPDDFEIKDFPDFGYMKLTNFMELYVIAKFLQDKEYELMDDSRSDNVIEKEPEFSNYLKKWVNDKTKLFSWAPYSMGFVCLDDHEVPEFPSKLIKFSDCFQLKNETKRGAWSAKNFNI